MSQASGVSIKVQIQKMPTHLMAMESAKTPRNLETFSKSVTLWIGMEKDSRAAEMIGNVVSSNGLGFRLEDAVRSQGRM